MGRANYDPGDYGRKRIFDINYSRRAAELVANRPNWLAQQIPQNVREKGRPMCPNGPLVEH